MSKTERKKKTAADPAPTMGRPSIRTPENAVAICAFIAEGMSLRTIAKQPGMPSTPAILAWLHDDVDFQAQYVRAREQQADAMAEEILEIADDAKLDTYTDPETGKVTTNQEVVQRSRLRVDARKWLASKLKPKVYGDKIEVAGRLTLETLVNEASKPPSE